MSATDGTVSPTSPAAEASKGSQIYSCVSCQQRKVKCDRQVPCAACVKAETQCILRVPQRPQPRKRKLLETVKDTRLKQYEQLLKGLGVNVDEINGADLQDRRDVEGLRQSAAPMHQNSTQLAAEMMTPTSVESERGRMVSDDGMSRLLDNNLWTGLSGEFRHPRDALRKSHQDGNFSSSISDSTHPDGGALLFGVTPLTTSLTSLHPQPVHIFRLWQTFLDNVNPLSKVIHAPTVQYQILEATGNLAGVSRSVESLMFAIYAAAVNSLDNSECEKIFGEPKTVLLAKYFMATQHALIRSGFLKSSDLVVLQALTLFLLALRQHYDPHALWILTGVAVRIGQRLGVHRDGASLGLSIFDSEIRRRLCWQIVLLDSRSAQLSGIGMSVTAQLWDSRLPLNVNDSDLTPEMREVPLEHSGVTEMIFCLIRYEFGNFLRANTTSGFDGNWQKLSSDKTPVSEKDRMLNQLENYLENKFSRFCDPLIPLHILSANLIKAVICKMRLVAHHPQQYPDKGASLSQEESDMLFATSLKMIEYDTLGQSMASLKRFLWHVNVHFQFDAFVYMLSELRHRLSGELVDRAWQQVQEVYDNHPELVTNTSNELYVAIGNLTIKAWTSREVGLSRQHQEVPEVPGFISTLRSQRRAADEVVSATLPESIRPSTGTGVEMTAEGQDSSYQIDQMDVYDGSLEPGLQFDETAIDLNPIDWDYWNGLLQENELQNLDASGQKLFG